MSYLICRGTNFRTGWLRDYGAGNDEDAPQNQIHPKRHVVQDRVSRIQFLTKLFFRYQEQRTRILPSIVERTNSIEGIRSYFSNMGGLQGTRLALDVKLE